MSTRFLSRCLLVTTIAVTALPAGAAAPRDPAASRQIYNDIHERLDAGGDLIVIANVDGLLEKTIETAREFASLAPSVPGSATDGAATLAKVSAFLKRNGFYAISGVGMSIVPRTDGMSDIKTFVARDADAARLPLWLALVGGRPSAMKCHAYLPKDTVLARSGTADMRALWQLVRSGVTEVGGNEVAAGFDMALAMVSAQAGITPDALIQSIAPEGALSIQFSTTSTVTIPLAGDSSAVTLPAPSLLLVTAVNDSTIIDTVKRAFAQHLQMPLPEVRLGDAVVYNVPLPVPAPFPVQITLATHGNYLLLGTTSAVVTDALNAATEGGGLKAVPEFARAFPAATPNNGIQFVSSRLGQTLKSIRDQMLGQMPAGSEEAAAFELFRNWMDKHLETGAAFTLHNLRTGVLLSGTSASGGQQVLGAMFAAPAGLLAGVAIPSVVKARSTAQHARCINNLRQIDSAKEQWAMAENKRDGEPMDDAGIAEYIYGGVIPACPQGGIYTINAIGADPTCSHPGHALP